MSYRKRLLIVEDEINLARVITTEARADGWEVSHAGTGEEALVHLEERFDVMLLDLSLPGMSGMDLYRSIIKDDNAPEVVIMTGNADVGNAVEAMKLGAYDYLQKPVPRERLFLVIDKAGEKSQLRFKNLLYMKKAEKEEKDFKGLIFVDPSMCEVLEMADKIARSESSVVILGETGVGKDVLASYIHRKSNRSSGPFVSINCASLQESMLENELFGHEKGAFTDAKERKLGFFDIASGGTLFLDEISEIPLAMQAKLLHVLEKNEFYRVGGTRIIKSDARILVATNRDLEKKVQEGMFRQDLYYRINMLSIYVPPLRERSLDILPLAENFLIQADKYLSEESKTLLLSYQWPGNVRELKHVIERAAIIAPLDRIEPVHLMIKVSSDRDPMQGPSLPARENNSLEEVEARHIRKILKKTDWKRSEAAKILDIDPKTLYRKIRKYRLEKE